MLNKSAETEQTFYTIPVSELKNWSSIKTRKEMLYYSHKHRTEEKFASLNLHGLCQGKRHQVSLTNSVPNGACSRLRAERLNM